MSAAAIRSPRTWHTAAARLNWRRAAGYGLLWGIACTALESFALPLSDVSAGELFGFVVQLLPHWCLSGVVLASAAMLLEGRSSLVLLAPALVAFALVVCAALWTLRTVVSSTLWMVRDGDYFHSFWGGLYYGGVFLAAYRLSMQSERTRALLAQAEIARQRTETLFSEARLLSLQGHVDPSFLLRAMTEVQRRYADDTAGMDRLLDPLVSFLRAAMPGVRSGASTLAAELLLAEHYAQVWGELEPGRVNWCLRVDGPMPDLPFPPLLLLPLLDQRSAASGPAQRVELRVASDATYCVVTLNHPVPGHAPWLEPDLMYRLQVGLRALFGEAWTMHNEPDSPAFALTLPAHVSRSSSTTHPETTHG